MHLYCFILVFLQNDLLPVVFSVSVTLFLLQLERMLLAILPSILKSTARGAHCLLSGLGQQQDLDSGLSRQ